MINRPLVPKRMAARLRAVYAKVEDARSYVAFAEAKILDCMMHLNEYETDPTLFALLHYPSTSGVDSYAVQTNIARTRSEIERKTERMPIYMQEVCAAEQAMETAEREILNSLASMMPDTPGRVTWSAEPKPLAFHRQESLREFKANRERYQQYLLRQHENRQEKISRRRSETEEFQRENDGLMEEALTAMPSNKAAVYRSVFNALKQATATGKFGMNEIVALANGDRDAFSPILEAAKQRIAGGISEQDTQPCNAPDLAQEAAQGPVILNVGLLH